MFSFLSPILTPWSRAELEIFWPLIAQGAMVSVALGLIGCFLVVRGLSLLGDALSHAVLPGIVIGFLGQGLFFGRWVIQWIVSERKAESQMPLAFWYLSLVGGLITLAYAIYRRDPVFIAGQSIGALVYVRNLMLIHRRGPQPASGSIASVGKQ